MTDIENEYSTPIKEGEPIMNRNGLSRNFKSVKYMNIQQKKKLRRFNHIPTFSFEKSSKRPDFLVGQPKPH